MAFGLTYKKNCFFIETSSDSIFADEDFAGMRISHLLQFSGLLSEEKDLKEQIALNHELNHAIQDLSVTSSIVEGEFRDTIKGLLSMVSKIPGIKFPVCDEANRIWNTKLVSSDKDNLENLNLLYDLYDIYDLIFLNSFVKPDIPEFKINSVNEHFFECYDLSITDLLETYAHHKSYWEQYLVSPMTESNAAVLHRITEESFLYPYKRSDDGFSFHSKFLKYSKPYHIVHAMLMVICRFDTKALADYYEHSIPKGYTSSVAYLMMRLTMSVLETSLCIPSYDYIYQYVKKDFASILAFSPVHRFYKILKNIYEADEFPELKEGEDYFITFHNWIASQNGWLDYETTVATVFQSLHRRAVEGKEVISNYQMTAMLYKFEHLTYCTYAFPLDIYRQINMPIMVKTSNKLVSLFFLGNHIYNETGLLRFIDLYFHPVDLDYKEGIVKYENISSENPPEDNIKRIMNNANGAKREIVIRMLAYEVLKSMTKRGSFSCPMRDGLCPHACDVCASFKSFRDIAPHCNRNIYRGSISKQVLNNNSGNSIDCMLFDYLLDYGFDPMAFEH